MVLEGGILDIEIMLVRGTIIGNDMVQEITLAMRAEARYRKTIREGER